MVAIAAVLAWGTIYETRFGTASVQRFIYQSWWFQGLLAFLAVNLAVAAFSRWPWKRKHTPFLLAHLGIILMLAGGIVGGRLGIDGQLIIAEGEENGTLQLPNNVLAAHQPNPGEHREFITRFETTSWLHHPHALFNIPVDGRLVKVVVDRYYPNAELQEEISDQGTEDNPAVRLLLTAETQEEGHWLFARDPQRFGLRWGDAHAFLLEPKSEQERRQLLHPEKPNPKDRGAVHVHFPDLGIEREIPVPAQMNKPVKVEGTPYVVTFKDYFPDFALSGEGPVNRSQEPNNPAVALTVAGPEGTDAHLLFALHPEFAEIHGRKPVIHSHLLFRHAAERALPPNSIGLVWGPAGLAAVLTGAEGKREAIESLSLGESYTHPGLGYRFKVTETYPKALRSEEYTNRDNEVRREVLHVTATDGDKTASAWLPLREIVHLPLGEDPESDPLILEYRPAVRGLPFTVKLIDFRKIDYPGTTMAAGFESDVELIDPERGVTLKRKINMNNPLKHRGYVLFQSSFVPGEVEITVLSVRNDPGTPLVYTGFLVIVAGVVAMFIRRPYRKPVGEAA